MFGCYRRGDANDPDTYCAAITAVLTRFSQDVVEYVTDPRTGIPGSVEWLPSVAEVKSACMARQGYIDRMADYSRRFNGRAPILSLPLDRHSAGRRANVFVPPEAPQYGRLCEVVKTADPADWKYDPQSRPGIWVAYNLLERPKPAEFSKVTDEMEKILEPSAEATE